MLLLFIYVALALGVSFLCSLLEAALLSVRTLDLEQLTDSKNASRLLNIKQNRLDDAISSVLALNTISNTAGSVLAGMQASFVIKENFSQSIGLELGSAIFTAFMTLGVLFFAEIPPKTLGATYATKLASFVGACLHYLLKCMFPVLVLTRLLTSLLTRDTTQKVSPGEVVAFLNMASRDGAIATREQKVFDNLMKYQAIRVEDVMTPRTVTVMLDEEMPIKALLQEQSCMAFSRIPIYQGSQDEVTGYVLQREILRDLAQTPEIQKSLKDYCRKTWFIPAVASIADALQQFLARREHLAMVLDEHGGVSGLITLEDLVETVLGTEIMDESDQHADLREVAADIREKRLQRRLAHAKKMDLSAEENGHPFSDAED